MSHTRLTTCRFCKGFSSNGEGMVKYGARHHAHFVCYLDAGKTLDKLPVWQVGEFPHRLLQERGLLATAEAIFHGNRQREGA